MASDSDTGTKVKESKKRSSSSGKSSHSKRPKVARTEVAVHSEDHMEVSDPSPADTMKTIVKHTESDSLGTVATRMPRGQVLRLNRDIGIDNETRKLFVAVTTKARDDGFEKNVEKWFEDSRCAVYLIMGGYQSSIDKITVPNSRSEGLIWVSMFSVDDVDAANSIVNMYSEDGIEFVEGALRLSRKQIEHVSENTPFICIRPEKVVREVYAAFHNPLDCERQIFMKTRRIVGKCLYFQ